MSVYGINLYNLCKRNEMNEAAKVLSGNLFTKKNQIIFIIIIIA